MGAAPRPGSATVCSLGCSRDGSGAGRVAGTAQRAFLGPFPGPGVETGRDGVGPAPRVHTQHQQSPWAGAAQARAPPGPLLLPCRCPSRAHPTHSTSSPRFSPASRSPCAHVPLAAAGSPYSPGDGGGPDTCSRAGSCRRPRTGASRTWLPAAAWLSGDNEPALPIWVTPPLPLLTRSPAPRPKKSGSRQPGEGRAGRPGLDTAHPHLALVGVADPPPLSP